MSAKGFDLKRFLVQKGERLGAGIAAVVMVLLLGKSVASGLRSERPTTVIQQIRGLAAVIEDRIQTGDAVSDPGLDPRLIGPRIHGPISAAAFKTGCDNFWPLGLEDDKRRNPSNYALVILSEGAQWEGYKLQEYGEPDAYGHRKKASIAADSYSWTGWRRIPSPKSTPHGRRVAMP